MVAIAQSVEHLIVVQKVARSSRVSHPTYSAGFQPFFFTLFADYPDYPYNPFLQSCFMQWSRIVRTNDLLIGDWIIV